MMGGVTESEEGIVRVATKFVEEGIKLHIDDGCLSGGERILHIDRGGMGGGGPVTYDKKLSIDDINGMYKNRKDRIIYGLNGHESMEFLWSYIIKGQRGSDISKKYAIKDNYCGDLYLC